MKCFKRIGYLTFALMAFIFGGLILCQNLFCPFGLAYAQDAYSGNICNNVIFVSFEDGDENWLSKIPECATGQDSYTIDAMTLLKNSYNDSVSSVENYYKVQSYGSLDIKSSFVTNSGKAIKVPYTKNQLLAYSPSNVSGYLEYEICSYSGSKVPDMLSMEYLMQTQHLFSCYNCNNQQLDGRSEYCDTETSDGIGCLCAYYELQKTRSNICQYEHVERLFREQIALKYVLNNATITGNVDSNRDGKVDALTFVFEGVEENVGWNNLLWAHQSMILDFSLYSLPDSQLPAFLSLHGVRDVNDSDFSSKLNILFLNPKKNGVTCSDYNLYLYSHLFKTVGNKPVRLLGGDNKEILSNYTLAHELGHVLGLPDYYVYDNDKNSEDPVSYWDLMSFSYYGVPLYLTTYNREKLGFLSTSNIVKLTNEGTYELKPVSYDEVYNNCVNSGNVLAYVYEDDDYPGQKIYMEYRNQEGNFESGIKNYFNSTYKNEGLIVYRIDENIVQAGYDNMLSVGNFYGYPHNMYVFRNGTNNYALNSNNDHINNITFQSYNTSKNQKQLLLSDVTFSNSGLKIEFVKLENGSLSFKISGGKLEEEDTRDIFQISLQGASIVEHEAKTSYEDLGINFGEFNESEFNITRKNEVNINLLGSYSYTYTLVLKRSPSKTLTLVRRVKIVDTTLPVVTLKGANNVVVETLNDFVDEGVIYSDNYDSVSNLILKTSAITFVSDNKYKITYTITDSSGNSAEIERFIVIQPKTDFSSITLKGDATVIIEVKSTYTDAGIDYGEFNEGDFDLERIDGVNVNVINSEQAYYLYTYRLTYKSTSENYSISRRVKVVDTTKPIVSLKGKSNLAITKISAFVDKGVEYSDNYDLAEDLTLSVSAPIKVAENQYKIVYTVTDLSNNSKSVERFLYILPNLFDSVVLQGENIVICEVKSIYTDLGVDYGDFEEDDFEESIVNDVNLNVINKSGEYYNYTYNLTYKETGEIISLVRKVRVRDSMAPTISLLGESEIEIYKSQVESYSDNNVKVNDNYCSVGQIAIIKRLEKIDENNYKYFYKAKDTSGNESVEIYRKIRIKVKPVVNSQISINVNDSDIVANEYYVGKTIKFSVKLNLVADNAQSQSIRFYINGVQVDSTTNTYFFYEFPDAGTYNIRICVGDSAYKDKTIVVKDMETKENPNQYNTIMLIGLGCGGGVMIVFSFVASVIGKKKRLKELDRY